MLRDKLRLEKATSIVEKFSKDKIELIGVGCNCVAFTNGKCILKVLIDIFCQPLEFKLTKEMVEKINKSNVIYPISDYVKIDGYNVIVCPVIDSVPVDILDEQSMITVATEMRKLKMVMLNIDPRNFVRINNRLVIIDYDLISMNEKAFINMLIRMWINITGKLNDRKLRRSLIENIGILNEGQIKSLQTFCNRVFENILESECEEISVKYKKENCSKTQTVINADRNIKEIADKLHLEGKRIAGITIKNEDKKRIIIETQKIVGNRNDVSLLIKCSAMEHETIEHQISHIVNQLCSVERFMQKIVVYDNKKRKYLRQYAKVGERALEVTEEKLNVMQKDRIIDGYYNVPNEVIPDLYARWFGIESKYSHTIKNMPLAPTLYGFEKCLGKYILHMDSDVIIGIEDKEWSFLNDMIMQIEKNENVISVGFNIFQHKDIQYKEYNGFENGGFVK